MPIQLFLVGLALPLLLLAGLREDLRSAQRRLATAQALFATAFRTAPDALAITRRSDGQALESNAQWRSLLGEAAADDPHLATQLDEPSHRKLHARLHESQATRSTEVRLRDRQGEPRALLLSSVAVDIGGEPCAIQRVRDITEQRAAELEAR
jgi:PAS domain S-box-containing protein